MRSIPAITFLCILFLYSPSLHGQEVTWQKTLGGDKDDILYSFIQTSTGEIIAAGASSSGFSGNKTVGSFGGGDFWIVRMDPDGNIINQKSLGGMYDDKLMKIQETSDGGLIAGGYSQSPVSGIKTEPCYGQSDFWLVKLDSSNNIEWQLALGGSLTESLISLELTSDGGYICGGYSNSPISGNKTDSTHGDYDYWVIKLDSTGVIQWQRSYGGSDGDWLHKIIPTPDNGFLLGGISESPISGDKTEGNIGSYDMWIIKIDSIGNIQWQNTIGGNGYDVLHDMNQTLDGGFILGGTSASSISGDKTQNCLGMWDYWIVKVDATGQILWQNTLGGTLSEEMYSVQPLADGGYICSGLSLSGISGNKTEINKGLQDYWIVKVDSVGNLVWQKTIGGSGDDRMKCIVPTGDGGFLGAGWTKSNISWDKYEDNYGKIDFWIFKLANQYNIITGEMFVDFNNNGFRDTIDLPVSNKMVKDDLSGRFCFTNVNGEYLLTTVDTGQYEVYPPPLLYYAMNPANHAGVFSNMQESDSLNDFMFTATGNYNDLCITITPATLFRSGRHSSYFINYVNNGTTIQSPQVIFYPDDNLTFLLASIPPDNISQDSIIWNLGALNPMQSGQILIQTMVANGLPQGTLINSGAAINPVAGDVNPSCNQSWWESFIVAPADPNCISVNRSSLYDYEMLTPPFLNYLIQFQNTGNDTAFYVKISNPINVAELDPGSVELLTMSHPGNMYYSYSENSLIFEFNNILLVDSNANEPGSHGFVHYRIRPKSSLVIGDSIFNQAHIYFDSNLPVATNIVFTEIIVPTSINEINTGTLKVYPNPAQNQITLVYTNVPTVAVNIKLFNIYGQELISKTEKNKTNSEGIVNLDISNLTSGIYFLKVDGINSQAIRFVKY